MHRTKDCVNKYYTMSRKQLLDPLGTMCKLISLNFCELHTKISIQNHILFIQKPDSYQSLVRIMNGDARENISELFYIILRLIKWYLIPIKNTSDSGNWTTINCSDEIIKLTKYLCIALKKLQMTYEYGNVVLAIQFYINLIEDTLDGKYNDGLLPGQFSDKDLECDTLLDYNKLKNFWDFGKLKRICESYENCFQITNDTGVNETDKKLLIDGYLSSITASLQIMDTDFQKLIVNSNRG